MKKLMIAASAALCATVGLCVESANIVGYITPEVKENVALGINAFTPVTGTTTDMQSIKVSGEGLAGGDVQIQTLTAGGATDRTFFWIPTSEVGDYEMEAEGWFDADNWVEASKTLSDGEGFVTMSSVEGAKITYSGAVADGATQFEIPSNVGVAGNATPVDIDIQSMVVIADGIAGGDVQIQTLTAGGATDRTFFWIPASEAGDYEMDGEGWFDADNWVVATDVTFAAGEGFVTMSGVEGAQIKLPSAL